LLWHAPDKAFANHKPKTDPVWGYILNSGPIRPGAIISTGATIKLIGEKYPRGDGYEWKNFEVIDVKKDDWKTMTIESHWWLIQPATNSLNIDKVNGERIDQFPKNNGYMTPYFLWGNGTHIASIRVDWLEYIDYEIDKPLYPYLDTSYLVMDAGRWTYPENFTPLTA